MSSIYVSNSAALNAALKTAQAGDTVYLASGTYSGISAYGAIKSGNVTITSADAERPAILTDLNVMNSNGFTFTNLEFAPKEGGNFAYRVDGSQNITFSNLDVHGTMNGTPQGDSWGISILRSSDIKILNSEFQQLGRGVGVGSSHDIEISGNKLHDLQSDGIDMADVQNVKIIGNEIKNFFPAEGDHPDAIQFWTEGTTKSSENIVIANNIISRGTGAGIQGIFMKDEVGTLPYKNVTISDNILVGTGYHGIGIFHGENLKITGNELFSYPGSTGLNWVLIQNADKVVVQNNAAIQYGFDNVTNFTNTGNTTNLAVTDGGKAALDAWMASHLGGEVTTPPPIVTEPPPVVVAPPPVVVEPPPVVVEPPPAAIIPVPEVSSSTSLVMDAVTKNLTLLGNKNIDGIGNGLDNVITGNKGSNYLFGGAGNDTIIDTNASDSDTLAGGTGNDTYYINGTGTNGKDLIVEKAGEGIDTVVASSSYSKFVLPANVENLVLTGAGGTTGYGNELNNVIIGNSGANFLDGMAGNDTIDGGAGNDLIAGREGNDLLTGGAGADTFWFAPGGGKDIITDFGANGDHDKLDFSYYGKMKPVLTDVGANLVISFSNGDAITLLGVHAHDLTATATGYVI